MLTVGAVIRESVYTTLRFVSWYLHQGADHIVLCFDDPNDPSIDILEGMDRVQCVRCTEDFWPKCGMTPDRRFTRRQNKAIEYVYRRAQPGWFLHVDGDELLHLEGRTIAQTLERMPDDVRGVRFLPCEEIAMPTSRHSLHFRLPMKKPAIRDVYGEHAPLMRKRLGLTGHHIGKSATRTGFDKAFMRQHFMHFEDRSVITDRVFGPAEGAFLLHFVDQGFDVWKSKLLWRLSAHGFAIPMERLVHDIMSSGDSLGKLRALYEKLHVFDRTRVAILQDNKVYFRARLQIDEIIKTYFPDHMAVSRAPATMPLMQPGLALAG